LPLLADAADIDAIMITPFSHYAITHYAIALIIDIDIIDITPLLLLLILAFH
jgi:hypothetical protein